MKKISIAFLAACLPVVLLLTSCAKNPRTEIVSSSIETSIATSGGISQIIAGYRPARIDFFVYDFANLPQVEDPGNYKQVTEWLVKYAHGYQNGEEMERSYYYHSEDDFKKGSRCKITVFYQIPDDGLFENVHFRYELDGFEAETDNFANNVKE